MAPKCTICIHKDRDKIDEAILVGTSIRNIGVQFGINPNTVQRHKKHIPPKLAKAKEAKEIVQADSLLSKARTLLNQAETITTAAQESKDYRTALQGIGRIKDVVELLMKVTGELDQKTEINVSLNIEFNKICQVIFKELEPYPEVRMRIADIIAEAKL